MNQEDIKRTMESIRDEFSFKPGFMSPVLGRTVEEIEKSKTLPARFYCADFALLTAYRLQQLGAKPIITVRKSSKWSSLSIHFAVEVDSTDGLFEISFERKIKVEKAGTDSSKRTIVRKPVRLTLKDNLKPYYGGVVAKMYRVARVINPKTWPTRSNQMKQAKKAKVMNQLLKRKTG